MITKEQFCDVINLIKKQIEQEEIFDKGMEMAFPESYAPTLPDHNLWDAVIKCLSYALNDVDEFIDWWINEDCMKGRLDITDNGIKYTFHNAEELYDYLVENYNNTKVNV